MEVAAFFTKAAADHQSLHLRVAGHEGSIPFHVDHSVWMSDTAVCRFSEFPPIRTLGG